MAWRVDFARDAQKQLAKLDRTAARRIVRHLEQLAMTGNLRDTGKPLKGTLSDYWRYRIGNYRAICEINDRQLLILVIEVGHRSSIYD